MDNQSFTNSNACKSNTDITENASIQLKALFNSFSRFLQNICKSSIGSFELIHPQRTLPSALGIFGVFLHCRPSLTVVGGQRRETGGGQKLFWSFTGFSTSNRLVTHALGSYEISSGSNMWNTGRTQNKAISLSTFNSKDISVAFGSVQYSNSLSLLTTKNI